MQRRRLVSNALTLLGGSALGLWSSAAKAQGVTGDQIVLGQSAPFSGPSQQLGSQFYLGAKLYFDDRNADGGIHGRKIEIKKMDDGYDPDRCVQNTKKLIDDEVFALFGYVGTAPSLAALPLATAAQMPFFAPLTGAQVLREPFNRYAIHVRASYFDETNAIVRQVTSVGVKKIAVFYQNDAYGKTGLDGVTRALKALDLEPVALGSVDRNSDDVDAALKTIMEGKPQAIVQIGTYKACATFVRLARRMGFDGNFYNLSFVGTQALMDELGAEARGVVVSQVVPFPYVNTTRLSGEYLGALQGKMGWAPNYSGMEGFVAAKVFCEALQRAGRGLTRDGFLKAVQSIKNLDLGGLSMDFGPTKNVGSKFVDLVMLTEIGRIRR